MGNYVQKQKERWFAHKKSEENEHQFAAANGGGNLKKKRVCGK